MKLILFVVLSLILVSFNDGSGAIGMAKKLEKFNGDEDKTTFTELNEDCLFLIFECLEFDGLLSVAQISGKYSMLAADVYRSKYSRIEVIIDDMHIELPEELKEMLNWTAIKIDVSAFDRIDRELSYPLNKMPELKNEQSMLLLDYETVLLMFKHFGAEIKKLCIMSHASSAPFKQSLVAYLITKYSTESLVGIKWKYYASVLLELITKPLVNVESVAFWDFSNRKLNSAQRVKNLFPQIKRLEISAFAQENERLQLDNVTELVILNGHMTSPVNLQFPRLQTLYMNYGSNLFAEHLQFLNEHTHLRHLHLNGLYMNDLQFQQLTHNLNDLVEVILERGFNCYNEEYRLGPTAILEFLKSHDKVKQLSVIDIISDVWRNELQEQLQNEWNIRTTDDNLSFDRK